MKKTFVILFSIGIFILSINKGMSISLYTPVSRHCIGEEGTMNCTDTTVICYKGFISSSNQQVANTDAKKYCEEFKKRNLNTNHTTKNAPDTNIGSQNFTETPSNKSAKELEKKENKDKEAQNSQENNQNSSNVATAAASGAAASAALSTEAKGTGGENDTKDDSQETVAEESIVNNTGDANIDNLVDAEEDESDKIGQSGMNKAISSVSTAAIGIGSMQLAQGLAEKKADKEAIRDMQDYLSKLYCSYSNKRANYGDVNITLDAEHRLDLLREEYFNKAAELKNTKEQLGLKAGIESEVILDEKTTGLYEYQDLGRASSTFGRLSEALLDENSRDAQMLAEQQATSQKRVTGGAIALGAGVVTSIGGHALVNAVAKKKAEQEANKTNDDTSTSSIPAETTQNDGGGNTNDNSITTENNESETETPTETDNPNSSLEIVDVNDLEISQDDFNQVNENLKVEQEITNLKQKISTLKSEIEKIENGTNSMSQIIQKNQKEIDELNKETKKYEEQIKRIEKR